MTHQTGVPHELNHSGFASTESPCVLVQHGWGLSGVGLPVYRPLIDCFSGLIPMRLGKKRPRANPGPKTVMATVVPIVPQTTQAS